MKLERTIGAKPAAVFAVLCDLEQARKWMPGIESIDDEPKGALAVGSAWIEHRKDPKGREFVSTISVTQLDAPTALSLHVSHKILDMDLHFTLAPDGAGTKVNYAASLKMKPLMFFMGGMVAKQMREVDGDLLDRLAAHIEKGTAKPARPATAMKSTKSSKK